MAAFADDRDCLDLPAQLAVPADPDRPEVGLALCELWRVQPGIRQAELLGVREAEAVVVALAPRLRV